MISFNLQRKTFLLLLVLVTIAFLAILFPFFGSVFWAGILALLFAPLQRLLLRWMPRRYNLAALSTVSLILFLVILPIALAGPALGMRWTIYLAWAIPPVLVLFVLMQLLRFGMSPRDASPRGPKTGTPEAVGVDDRA